MPETPLMKQQRAAAQQEPNTDRAKLTEILEIVRRLDNPLPSGLKRGVQNLATEAKVTFDVMLQQVIERGLAGMNDDQGLD